MPDSDQLHVAIVLEEADRELQHELNDRDDVEVLFILRYAVVLDRGAQVITTPGIPPPDVLARIQPRDRRALSDALRRASEALDPLRAPEGPPSTCTPAMPADDDTVGLF